MTFYSLMNLAKGPSFQVTFKVVTDFDSFSTISAFFFGTASYSVLLIRPCVLAQVS